MRRAAPELIDIVPVCDIPVEQIAHLADVSPPGLPGPGAGRCCVVWPNGLVAIVPHDPSPEALRLAYCDAEFMRVLIGTRLGAELWHARQAARRSLDKTTRCH